MKAIWDTLVRALGNGASVSFFTRDFPFMVTLVGSNVVQSGAEKKLIYSDLQVIF